MTTLARQVKNLKNEIDQQIEISKREISKEIERLESVIGVTIYINDRIDITLDYDIDEDEYDTIRFKELK